MTWRVIVGTVSVVITMILFGFVAVTEQDRMASFGAAYAARQIDTGAALYDNNCALCHGPEGKGTGRAPALNAVDLFDGTRLAEVGWAGSTDNYVRAAIAGGRPRPSASFSNYPERMPTWGEEYGGPLRRDQVDSLVAFVMNWGPAYAGAVAAPTAVIDGVGSDINVELPAGNAANGRAVAERTGIVCTACHVGPSLVGPAWLASDAADGIGVGTHAQERYQAPGYTGQATSAEQYLLESIVQPSAYIVPGGAFASAEGRSFMPADFGQKLTKQDTADLIAYLLTLK